MGTVWKYEAIQLVWSCAISFWFCNSEVLFNWCDLQRYCNYPPCQLPIFQGGEGFIPSSMTTNRRNDQRYTEPNSVASIVPSLHYWKTFCPQDGYTVLWYVVSAPLCIREKLHVIMIASGYVYIYITKDWLLRMFTIWPGDPGPNLNMINR